MMTAFLFSVAKQGGLFLEWMFWDK